MDLLWGPHDSLLVLDRTFDWLIKPMFLGEVDTAVPSGIQSRFGIKGFQHE